MNKLEKVLGISLAAILLMNPLKVMAGSASVFLNQTSDLMVYSESILTDSAYPVEYYVNVGDTSAGNVNFMISSHYDYGLSNADYLYKSVCPVGTRMATPIFDGTEAPLIPYTNLASMVLWGADGPKLKQKYIAGAVIYSSYELTRGIFDKDEIKQYIDECVQLMDQDNIIEE